MESGATTIDVASDVYSWKSHFALGVKAVVEKNSTTKGGTVDRERASGPLHALTRWIDKCPSPAIEVNSDSCAVHANLLLGTETVPQSNPSPHIGSVGFECAHPRTVKSEQRNFNPSK